MQRIVDLLFWGFFGLGAWETSAYTVAWWRTHQPLFGWAAGGAALSSSVILAMELTKTYPVPVLLGISMVTSGLSTRLPSVIQRTYGSGWDPFLFRQPRRRE